MYLALVVGLMLVLPSLSVLAEAALAHLPLTMPLIGKWFVFWLVGARLFLAGLRQVVQPRYTAEVILGLKSDEPLVLVRELGFANLAMGSVGLASLFMPTWRIAGALAGGVFYALAGLNHAIQPHRNRLENIAMTSDLFAAGLLFADCAHAAWAAGTA